MMSLKQSTRWTTCNEAFPMGGDGSSHDWRHRKLQEWLLLLLRFAVTREPADRSATLAMADELDSLGMRWRPGGPRFFLQTSIEVCEAVVASNDVRTNPVLRRHLARIDDPRLRRAFHAAVACRPRRVQQTSAPARRNGDLWKGLPSR
jgi:hypothetical protein